MSTNERIGKLAGEITAIVGKRYCLTNDRRTERFRKGFRSGEGDAAIVAIPGTLVEMWKVLQHVVAADCIITMQAANTGLTEGSTPKGSYDRDVVIISTLRLNRIHVLDNGHQIVSQPGGTLFELEKRLRPYGREPHSVIGSSCIGASIVGGVCNNSGGALVRRGPVYTELSLYAQRTAAGELVLINQLGIDLGDTPEDILGRLDRGEIDPARVAGNAGRASNDGYAGRIRDVDADTPARYNAEPGGLFEASGSAGKVAIFAVRLDTFPKDENTRPFHPGLSRLTPEALPKRLLGFRDRFEHHLILKVPGAVVDRTEALLTDTIGPEGWFLCTDQESKKAMLHRFAAAGAAIRYGIVEPNRVEAILSLDIALRRSDGNWFEHRLPKSRRRSRRSYITAISSATSCTRTTPSRKTATPRS